MSRSSSLSRARAGRLLVALALVAGACSGGSDPVASEASRTPFAGLEPPLTAGPVPIEPVPNASSAPAPAATAPVADGAVELLTLEVIEAFAHDPAAWTQGLLFDADDMLLESTGIATDSEIPSDLRRVRPDTGEVIQSVEAPGGVFAEGLAQVGDQLIQLTWRDERAFYWDATSFELQREVTYSGEGWGLCHDGERLVMSDGSSNLVFRDPATFDEIGRVTVTVQGTELADLNELECVGGMVWANVWLTDFIVRIDPATGAVGALVDASALQQPRTDGVNVLNGIAYQESTDSFYITGKLWPQMYRVRFVSASTPEGN